MVSKRAERAHTPDSTREGNENAESLGVLLGAFVGLETLENSNHGGEDEDFTGRADGEGDIRDAITLQRFQFGMAVDATMKNYLWVRANEDMAKERHPFSPDATWRADSLTAGVSSQKLVCSGRFQWISPSGRFLASPGKAAVQNVSLRRKGWFAEVIIA
jgi:hypothetical protein